MSYQVAVIGAGAAGMMAAHIAAKNGKKVCLIEKNPYPGKKILITGKGRCNVTNSADIEDFIANTAVNANFLYSAFYSFTNNDLISLLENEGLKLKTERGGRVFPVSDKASDVRDTLFNLAKNSGAEYATGQVLSVEKTGDAFVVSLKNNKTITASSVIIATGGVSYPLTGSTGDGYKFAKESGHTIIEPKASLVPLVTEEKYVYDLMGLSLKNVAVTLKKNGKEIYSDFGEMLFTHFGLSGPVVLSSSSHIRDNGKYTFSIEVTSLPKLILTTRAFSSIKALAVFSKKLSEKIKPAESVKLIPINSTLGATPCIP